MSKVVYRCEYCGTLSDNLSANCRNCGAGITQPHHDDENEIPYYNYNTILHIIMGVKHQVEGIQTQIYLAESECDGELAIYNVLYRSDFCEPKHTVGGRRVINLRKQIRDYNQSIYEIIESLNSLFVHTNMEDCDSHILIEDAMSRKFPD